MNSIITPYLKGKCEECIYHYLLDGDESRCVAFKIGMSDVMCVQVKECGKYKKAENKNDY